MKKIFILCSCLLLLLLITGCGSRKEEFQSATHMAPSSGTIAPEIESIPEETSTSAPAEKETTIIVEEITTEPLLIEETYYVEEETYYEEETYSSIEENSIQYDSSQFYSPSDFQMLGIIYWNGWRWTWYSQNVLPGGGLNIPGRHVDENGYVCDGNENICLASSVLGYGTIVDTPFGKTGCVYDSGCDVDVLDVYVAW